MKILKTLLLTAAFPASAMATTTLENLQHDWSVCQYQTLEAKKESCFTTLSQRSGKK